MTKTANRGTPTSLKSGVIWNLGSLGFLALAGLMLNFAIARFYGSEALGVFNVAFAIYIFASQFGTFGIHFSILQAVSEFHETEHATSDNAVTSGIIAITIAATLTVFAAFFFIPVMGKIYGEKAPGVVTACLAILPGLWAFCINKGLYNVINGARHMRVFAVLQALRYVIILICFGVLVYLRVDPALLTLVFTISEFLLLPILIFFTSKAISSWRLDNLGIWTRKHTWFGARVFLSGAILELNTRVDILMLTYFIDASAAGIYTVAALVAEGGAQMIFAIRNNFNPVITRMVVDKDKDGLLALSRKAVLLFTPFMLCVSTIAYFIFPIFSNIMFGDPVYLAARWPLIILFGGLTLAGGLIAFNMIFAQAGRPGTHTLYVLGIFFANIVLNLILIPKFGIIGAAMATAGSYIISVILLVVLVRILFKMRILI